MPHHDDVADGRRRVASAALLLLVAALLVLVGAPARATPAAGPPPVGAAPTGAIVRGQVLRADGTPLTTAVVRVVEATSIGQLFAEALVTGLSGGLTLLDCFAKDPVLRICRTERETAGRVDAQGRYAVPVPDGNGRYIVSVLGTVGQAKGRALLRTDVAVPPAGRTLPTLRMWDARTRASVGDGRLVAEWDRLPDAYAEAVEYYAVADPDRPDGASARLRGRKRDVRAGADARLFEDSAGRVTAYAEGFVGDVEVTWLGLPVPHPAPAGPPPTRGLPCRVQVGGDVVTASPCWLTDGRTGQGPPPAVSRFVCRSEDDGYDRCRAPAVTSAVLDLGRVQPLDVVVLRGCEQCRVGTSADRVVWEPGPVPERDAPLLRLDGRRARYVRISVAGPTVGRVVEALGSAELRPSTSGDPFEIPEPVPLPPPAQPTDDFGPPIDGPLVNDLSLLSDVAVWPMVASPAPRDAAGPPEVAAAPRRDDVGPAALLALLLLGAAGAATAREAVRRSRGPSVPAPRSPGSDVWRPPPDPRR